MGEKLTELKVQHKLFRRFFGTSNIMMPNYNLNKFEADFIKVTKAGYVYEYEIKLTYSDFLAEKRKVVSKIIDNKTGEFTPRLYDEEGNRNERVEYQKLEAYRKRLITTPNYFIYVVSPDISDKVKENLPDGCGLWEVVDNWCGLKELVKPKRIHGDKCKASLIPDIYRIGCNRYLYNHWYK